jgi:hypothetical protein
MKCNAMESLKAFFFPAQTSKNSNSELPSERVKMGEMAHGCYDNPTPAPYSSYFFRMDTGISSSFASIVVR